MRDSPDQAAHDHALGPMLGASCLTQHFAGLRVKAVLIYSKWLDVAISKV